MTLFIGMPGQADALVVALFTVIGGFLCSIPGISFLCSMFSNTGGDCLSTATALRDVLDSSTAGDAVYVCAGSTIATTTAILIEESNITLACKPTLFNRKECVFQSTGKNNRNLVVSGDSITLQGITFLDGRVEAPAGGNVAIFSEGDHIIRDCIFRNGQAVEIGGNLFVQADDGTLTIENSVFSNGKANEAGGGLYVLNANKLTIRDCLFEGNAALGMGGSGAGASGGGFFSLLESADADPGQEIVIDNTRFTSNSAGFGGGFCATQLGQLPSLTVLNSAFTSNIGYDGGGAAAIFQSLDSLLLTVTDSSGTNNTSPYICPDFLGFFDNSPQPFCFSPNDNLP